ncbi:hypothetical protein [Winogradskyella luteola]|uniref:Uncharacterized protein n=1 Tax=Winogradskyella luteola TaxID=2828330 RepID=A0A9X1F5E7_9FLAO|nr:hypothetical protein [Winogradskyella luteola]MBV7267662.1 hypothetical protein [Winogradskyella luteola]
MKFELRKSKVIRNLFIVVGILLLGNLFAVFLRFNTEGMNSKMTRLIIKLFDFNLEANLPTYFSSLVLLSNGVLLALIGSRHKAIGNKFWHWLGLSIIFVFLAFDEMIQIHEQLRAPMESLFNTTGLLYFAWFIPYTLVTIIIALAYFKFMMRLPKHVLKLFVIAGILYVFGAVGMEAIGGMHAEVEGQYTFAYAMMYSFEELLEMSGAVVFFYALLVYITTEFKNLKVRFKPKKNKNSNVVEA